MLAALLVFGSPGFAATPAGRTERVQFLGRDYVRLADYARASGLKLQWLKRDELLALSNRTQRMAFTVDSRCARINEVNVWLSFPVAGRSGHAYVSWLDVQTTLQPLLTPARWPRGAKIQTIALDPGHGGTDTGFKVGTVLEKNYTLLLSQELCDQLTRAGFKVILTRTRDREVGLSERPDLARRQGADLFLSLHFNAAADSSARGVEVFCLTPAGAGSTNARGATGDRSPCRGNRHDDHNVLLAYTLQRALVTQLGAEDRGVRRARFQVLREADLPAALVEAGFLSNPTEQRKITDPAHRRLIARALVAGILEFKRLIEA